jgi:hypothetical protein
VSARVSTHRGAHRAGRLVALLVLSGAATLAIPRGPAWGQRVAGQAIAATVNTAGAGSQTFAAATLPATGGMENADVDNAAVPGTFGASGLTSITTGQIDQGLVSATTSAEAADVKILNGLITAKAVLALATSYANGTSAASESDGSTVLNLVIAGVSYADGAPAPNTRVPLPGVGYVVLNEQIAGGDRVHSTSLTVKMIHVYLINLLTGGSAGEIVVGAATSTATL